MATIGQQIIAARRAKGMTQDELAKALNLSRSSVSNYETDRRLPDAAMLLRLSDVLDYRFEDASAQDAQAQEPAPPESGSPAGAGSPAEALQKAPAPRSKALRVAAWALAAVAVCACVAVVLLRGRPGPATYTAGDGTKYTIEQFRQDTPRKDGAAWFSCEQVLRTQQSDGMDMWMYEFIYHEMNGVGASVDRLEAYTFVSDAVHPRIIDAETLRSFGMETAIAPHGDWSFTGGLPVQDKVVGIGIRLSVTDDNGEPLTFTSYLPLNP